MLLLALGLSSCERGETPVDAELLTRTIADSTAADSAAGLTIVVDTAWEGEYYYTYSGNPKWHIRGCAIMIDYFYSQLSVK